MSRLDQFHCFQEKLAAGGAALVSAGIASAGAMITSGEVRWVCITLAASILMAMFVAVLLRAPGETMKLTIARAGFSVMLGVLGTRELLIRWGAQSFEGDAIRLAFISSCMTIAGMVLGYPLLLLANTRGKSWARIILEKIGPKPPAPPE
jgi:hypothetical protein